MTRTVPGEFIGADESESISLSPALADCRDFLNGPLGGEDAFAQEIQPDRP
ncbi:hypothetical protein SAMN05216223_11575 [Actinacidiphila yanglinensis]|uniref:Uncharacterized protein n=1 Tax=Actinacidiphila yanglinensis TaxID=310779 RepID=A0A1H6DG36_9ACTN|nr:hypothetical protein SAMN05216223_11575 [Actinacidiphila yanglinensis]